MSNLTKQKNFILLCVLVGVLTVLAVLLLGRTKTGREGEAIKAGFIMTGLIDEGGWNSMNYEGVKAACEETGMKLITREAIEEFSGKCPEAIEDLVEQGAKVIFLSSYHYTEEAKEVIEKNSDVYFFANTTAETNSENLSTYFPRMYQARYLSGIVAGATTQSNVIGYVAAMENCEVIRGINAFALGAQQANPDVQVVVIYTGDWSNEQAERDAVGKLVKECDADVIAYHQNLPFVVDEAQTLGAWSIAYHEDGTFLSEKCLTSVVCDWKQLYRELQKEYATGKTQAGNMLWLGIDRGVVGLASYGDDVSEQVREQVENAKEELISGKEIFSGTLVDNQGVLRCGEGEMLSDNYLRDEIMWLIKGVTVYEE